MMAPEAKSRLKKRLNTFVGDPPPPFHSSKRGQTSQVKNYSPKHMKQNAAEKNTGEACPRGGRVVLCECMRCSSSWKAAWAECTCVGAPRTYL